LTLGLVGGKSAANLAIPTGPVVDTAI